MGKCRGYKEFLCTNLYTLILWPGDHPEMPFHTHRLMKWFVAIKLVSPVLLKTKFDRSCLILRKIDFLNNLSAGVLDGKIMWTGGNIRYLE